MGFVGNYLCGRKPESRCKAEDDKSKTNNVILMDILNLAKSYIPTTYFLIMKTGDTFLLRKK